MARTFVTNTVLKINGKEVENSFNAVNGTVRGLTRELRKLEIGTEDWKKKAEDLKAAKAQFEEIKRDINASTEAMEKFSGVTGFLQKKLISIGDTFRQVFTANALEGFIGTAFGKIKATVSEFISISDAMTDVQKTSGMSLQQVKALWDSFDQMDTRTTKKGRLKIAEIGGRLGVSAQEMTGFVQEIDKAYVALGDSFSGGLEDVVEKLGKIKGLFEDTQGMSYAEAVNRVGSALNTLAAQGTASEGNISDFALRLGALPDALKPSIDKVLGLGAAFEESGIDSQIASSGFTNFISTAAENIDLFAKSMGMPIQKAKELINTKPEEFFLRFSEGMKGLPADQTAKIFASLKLNSLEVQKAVGAASNRTDDFRKSMETAAVEMDKMSSLQDEFNSKNNNSPAILEKLKNAWNDVFTSTNVINFFDSVISSIGWLTGVTSQASNGAYVLKERLSFLFSILKVVVSAMISYNTVAVIASIANGNLAKSTWLTIVADKAQAVALLAKRTAMLLWNVAVGLVTLNINKAKEAMAAFNVVTKMNPWGAIISVITVAVIAYREFNKELDATSKKQKILNDVQIEAEKSIISQKNEMNQLLKIARDETLSKEKRLDAIKKINEISPQYLGFINLENIGTREATKAINQYNESLVRNAKIKALNKKLEETQEGIIDVENAPISKNGNWVDRNLSFLSNIKKLDKDQEVQYNKWQKQYGKTYADQMMDSFGYVYENRKQKLKGLNKEAEDISMQITNMTKEVAPITQDKGGNPTNSIVPGNDRKNKDPLTELEKRKRELEDIRKKEEEANKKLLELQNEFQSSKTALIRDAYEKEKQEEKDRRAQERKASEQQIVELEQRKKVSKSTNEKNTIASSISLIEKIDANKEQAHLFKLLEMQQRYELEFFQSVLNADKKKIEENRRVQEEEIISLQSFEQAKEKLQGTVSAQELSKVKTLEDAKSELRKQADEEMLRSQLYSFEVQKKNLEKMISEMTEGPAKKKLLEDLENLNSEITKVKTSIDGSGGDKKDNKGGFQHDPKENIDILGFSAKDWEDTFSNLDSTEGKIKAAQMAVQALSNAFQMYSQLQQNLGEREMRGFERNQNKKKKELLKQLNEGLINQEEYNKQLELFEVEKANKQAQIAYEQAKVQKAVQIATAISNTAIGVTQALASSAPPYSFILAGIVGAMGAAQVGVIASTPLPEKASYAVGGYTGNGFGSVDQSGFKPAGIVHENEWVAPRWMLESPRTAKVIDYLESVRQGKTTPMAEGGFSSSGVTSNNSNSIQNIEVLPHSEMKEVLQDLTELLRFLKENGVDAWMVEDAENGKRMKKTIKLFEQIENRNSRN